MEDIILDEVSLGLITIKVIIGFITLYTIVTLTGRMGISQLTPIHFIFIIMIDDFLGHIIYENNESIIKFLFAVGLWTFLIFCIEFVSLKLSKVRLFLQGKPICIIKNGQLERNEIKKAKLDVNKVLSLLRQQRVFSVREVEFGILEPNGKLSIALKSKYENPTIKDLNLPNKKITLPVPLIIDGKIMRNSLDENGLDEKWLRQELKENGYIDLKNIFYAEWKENEGLYVSDK